MSAADHIVNYLLFSENNRIPSVCPSVCLSVVLLYFVSRLLLNSITLSMPNFGLHLSSALLLFF